MSTHNLTPIDFGIEPTIFARSPFTPASEAVLLSAEPLDGCGPSAPDYKYLLEVSIAREVLGVWTAWRDGGAPTISEATEAIIYYALNDSYLPTD